MKTIFDKFISDPKRHRIYEREALALQASELIFELMEKEGINKAELAERLDASRAYITQILSGSRNMTMHTLADLTYALGHKIGLEALPLHGGKSSVVQYIPRQTDKQNSLFGSTAQEQSLGDDCEETETDNFPAAA